MAGSFGRGVFIPLPAKPGNERIIAGRARAARLEPDGR
jgi:hypothetical protein